MSGVGFASRKVKTSSSSIVTAYLMKILTNVKIFMKVSSQPSVIKITDNCHSAVLTFSVSSASALNKKNVLGISESDSNIFYLFIPAEVPTCHSFRHQREITISCSPLTF